MYLCAFTVGIHIEGLFGYYISILHQQTSFLTPPTLSQIIMNLIDAWCPLCIRSICFSIFRFLGIKRKKEEIKLYSQTRIVDHEHDNLISDTREWQRESEDKRNGEHLGEKGKGQKQRIQVTTQELFDNEKEVLLEDTRNQGKGLLQKTNQQHITPEHQISPATAIQSQPTHTPLITLPQFPNSLPQPNPYHNLLTSKLLLLQQKLLLPFTPIPSPSTSKCNLQILHTQPNDLNIFLYKFTLPCSYSTYQSITNDYTLQKKFDTNIDQFYMLEQVADRAKVNYVSYKRVLAVSPRDFVYLKYAVSEGREHLDLSFSVQKEVQVNIVRGQIVLTAWKVTEVEVGVEVEVYSEVDMRMTVNPKITRTQSINQIRKYVDKLYEYVISTNSN